MRVTCCSPDINVPYLGTPGTRFGSQEALFFLQKCNNFKKLKQVHGRIIRFGLSYDQLLIRKLIELSSTFGKLNYATMVFDQLNSPDTFTWNVMIRACTISGSPKMALLLFKAMLCQGLAPDKFTYPFLINACMASSALGFGRVAHALAIKMGFWGDLYVQNTMMNLYFKCENVDGACKVFDKMRVRNVFTWTTVIAGLVACGKLDTARKLFERMPSKNVVAWTAMIDGYVKHKQPIEAFNLFERMQVDDVRPNEYTLVSLVRACTEMGSLRLGRRVHDYALKNGFELEPFLGTALIDMYSKCDSLDDARTVFDMMQVRTLATWNTMITSLGVHGFRVEAISLFEEMEKANEAPDAITFVGVLSACIYMNDVELAQKYFNLMTDRYGITPILEHYECMVEIYTRAYRLDEIYTLGNAMESNHDVAELLRKSKLTSINDIKKLILKQYGDVAFSELVLDHSSTSSSGTQIDINQTSK
ncbi:pentatricopeptide repeat-containing protein At3g26630, chloroplastic [Cajanus cajan]|uniref:pentatricopeptide repeat-containing protein At3g26630, chloroplastic n=1 Tax=Cajanus cajan TaxID=3821 RepID=UPI00098D8379|nr:pentatricopeptide repeat-containing protein At3g26630, chloroplastic [Cajanus cajan]XP_020206748.1 pentatricopeptide repeat-containing protein At3g26630, chloroplastic [Cajanus cajan]